MCFLKHGDLSTGSLTDFTMVPRNPTSQIWWESDFQPVTTYPCHLPLFPHCRHFCPTCQVRTVASKWLKPHFPLIIMNPSWKDLSARNTSLRFVKAVFSYSTTVQVKSVLNAPHLPDTCGDRLVHRTQFRGWKLCARFKSACFSTSACPEEAKFRQFMWN